MRPVEQRRLGSRQLTFGLVLAVLGVVLVGCSSPEDPGSLGRDYVKPLSPAANERAQQELEAQDRSDSQVTGNADPATGRVHLELTALDRDDVDISSLTVDLPPDAKVVGAEPECRLGQKLRCVWRSQLERGQPVSVDFVVELPDDAQDRQIHVEAETMGFGLDNDPNPENNFLTLEL